MANKRYSLRSSLGFRRTVPKMVTRDNDEHLLSHALRETLDAVVSPSVRDALLTEALVAAKHRRAPARARGISLLSRGAAARHAGPSARLRARRFGRPGARAPDRSRLEPTRPAAPPGARAAGSSEAPAAAPRRRPPSPRGEWPFAPSAAEHDEERCGAPGRVGTARVPHAPAAGTRNADPDGRAAAGAEASDPRLLPYSPTLPAGKKPLSSRAPQPLRPSCRAVPLRASRWRVLSADTDRPRGFRWCWSRRANCRSPESSRSGSIRARRAARDHARIAFAQGRRRGQRAHRHRRRLRVPVGPPQVAGRRGRRALAVGAGRVVGSRPPIEREIA